MPYLDKEGSPLTKEDWQAKIRDPDYCRVRFTRRGTHLITTTWLGFYWGSNKKIFLVEFDKLWRSGVDSFEHREPISCCWCETLAEAIEKHKKYEGEAK